MKKYMFINWQLKKNGAVHQNHELPKLSQDGIDNLTIPITIKDQYLLWVQIQKYWTKYEQWVSLFTNSNQLVVGGTQNRIQIVTSVSKCTQWGELKKSKTMEFLKAVFGNCKAKHRKNYTPTLVVCSQGWQCWNCSADTLGLQISKYIVDKETKFFYGRKKVTHKSRGLLFLEWTLWF